MCIVILSVFGLGPIQTEFEYCIKFEYVARFVHFMRHGKKFVWFLKVEDLPLLSAKSFVGFLIFYLRIQY